MTVGDIVTDKDGSKCVIIDMTSNSVNVYIEKKSETGISCSNWFTIQDFNKRFK